MTLSALGISKRVSELLKSHLKAEDLGLASTWHRRSMPSERFCGKVHCIHDLNTVRVTIG